MSLTAAPYGLKPLKMIGSQAFAAAIIEVPMTTNSAVAIFTGSMVALNAGQPVPAAATPTTTRSTSTPSGVCVGVRYTDPVLKQEQHAMFLPANAITNGYTNVFIKMVDDPDCLFMVQATAAVAATARGSNAALASIATGSTTYGTSTMSLDAATVATTATLAMRIIGFSTDPRDAIGDAFTNVIVKFNQGVHAYYNATGG